jgi:hypothetical protein
LLVPLLALGLCGVLAVSGLAVEPPGPGSSAGSPDSARIARWREDLAVLRRDLPASHKNLFWRTPRAEFERLLDSLDRGVPRLTDAQIVTGMTRACAVADAHTMLGWGSGVVRFRMLPLHAVRFEEGWHVLAAGEGALPALGGRLIAIDGMPMEAVVEALRPFVSHDNDAWLIERLPEWLRAPEMLCAAGVTRDTLGATLSLRDSTGRAFELEVRSLDSADSIRWHTWISVNRVPQPLARTRPGSHYWSEWLPGSRTLFLRYNRCAEMDTLPLRPFLARLLAAIDSLGPERLVVDLRANEGGSSPLLRPLIDGLRARPRWTRGGRVRVLTGRRTFSSAVMNAHELRTRLGAIVIGGPTGGALDAYGEVRSFRLPRSDIRVDYSTRRFRLAGRGDTRWLLPDVPVPTRWEDYRRSRDAALERALAPEPVPSTPDQSGGP